MIAIRRFLAVITVSGLLSPKARVDGSKESCPSVAVIDLTEEKLSASGSVNKSGYVFPRDSIWSENDRSFGCLCDLVPCFAYCGNAIKLFRLLNEEFNTDIYVFQHDPCPLAYDSIGSFETDYKHAVGFEKFCLLRHPYSIKHSAKVCTTDVAIWIIFCLNVSVLFTLATFTVYAVMPKLRNLHGLLLRCYLVAYIGCMFFMTAWISLGTYSSKFTIYYNVIGYGLIYFGTASLLWINVMSFDIWRKFRTFQSRPDAHLEYHQKVKFLHYSIYAWCSPAVFTLIQIIRIEWIGEQGVIQIKSPVQRFSLCVSPVIGIFICNMYFYISTALKIKQRKKEIAHLFDGVNTYHEENEQWFNLYLKLFVIMGGPLVLWAVALYMWNGVIFQCLAIIEALQGFSIFLIFVWKDDVILLLRQRFDEMFHTLSSAHQRN